jgi:hypothetical protein
LLEATAEEMALEPIAVTVVPKPTQKSGTTTAGPILTISISIKNP